MNFDVEKNYDFIFTNLKGKFNSSFNNGLQTSTVFVNFCSKTNSMHQCIKFILFWNDTQHVSDGLSVHHQQFKILHTAVKQILLSAC